MGFSLGHSKKLFLLDLVGGHFADKVIEEVIKGKKLQGTNILHNSTYGLAKFLLFHSLSLFIQGTGDNWDLRIHPHDMRKDNQNEDLHYFASCLIVERVPCIESTDVSPQKDIKTLPNSEFLLNEEETTKLRNDFMVLVGRELIKYIPSLSFLKSVVPLHIQHMYQREMSQKSTIVPLPMQLKDEKQYDDVVDILCDYENTVEDIYAKAGVIQLPQDNRPAQPDGPLQGLHSDPDQPGGHSNRNDPEDHLQNISVPFGGDQLTRVRFVGAKDLRRGCHTAKDRFDHVSPFTVELFHTKMSFVQVHTLHINSYNYMVE